MVLMTALLFSFHTTRNFAIEIHINSKWQTLEERPVFERGEESTLVMTLSPLDQSFPVFYSNPATILPGLKTPIKTPLETLNRTPL